MSTKDNPGTLPIYLYAQVQPTITPLDFWKIAEDKQDGARTTDRRDNSHELFYTSGDVVFLASDDTSGQTVVYVLEESITASTKKAKARLLDTDQDRAEDARPRHASRARKRPHTDDFLFYDVRTGFLVFPKHYPYLLEKVDAITICFNFLLRNTFTKNLILKG